MITSIRNAALRIAAASMVASPVAANVGDSMDRFMDDMGAAANVTGPSAFEGQSAGYYSLGNVWTRFPQKTTTSVVGIPASCSFKTAMICSSLNLLRFIIVRLLCVGLYQKPVTFQGSTSSPTARRPNRVADICDSLR